MLKKFLASATVLAIVATASATITASLSGPTDVTLTPGAAQYYDIMVTISNQDDWTVGGLTATCDTLFYQDAVNDSNPPNPGFFGFVPDSEFTSFYTSPATWPNAAYNASAVGIASTNDSALLLDTDWFDTIDSGDGTFTIARVTIMGVGTAGQLDLQVGARNSGGTLFSYSWTVPEPSTLALVALGGLAGLIRRR